MLVEDIELANKSLVVQIQNTKTKISGSFCIVGKYVDYYYYIEFLLYFFLNRMSVTNPVGINTFGKIPSIVAKFFGLPELKQFTGLYFRRSPASLLVESGAKITEIKKKHGAWNFTIIPNCSQKLYYGRNTFAF